MQLVTQLQEMSLERWYRSTLSWRSQVGRKGEEFTCRFLPVCLRWQHLPWSMNVPHSLVGCFFLSPWTTSLKPLHGSHHVESGSWGCYSSCSDGCNTAITKTDSYPLERWRKLIVSGDEKQGLQKDVSSVEPFWLGEEAEQVAETQGADGAEYIWGDA